MTDTTDLKARLRKGVPEVGLHEDNCTELFDVDGASEMMFEAADALDAKDRTIERFEAEVERLRADLRSCEAALGRRTEERNNFAERLRKAADDLRTVGDDYPGSACHKWCHERAAEALKGQTP